MTMTAIPSAQVNPAPGSAHGHRGFTMGIPVVVLLAVLLTMAGVGWLGVQLAQEQLGEARAAKAAAVAGAVQSDLERALGYGIPLSGIAGVAPYLEGIAGRNPDLGFLAVGDAGGTVLHAVGLGRERLASLMAPAKGEAVPATRSTVPVPVERDGYLIVRLPLQPAADKPVTGHVLVGVQPKQIRSQIAAELVTVVLGVAAVLILLSEVAAALAAATFGAPLDRLAQVMGEAARGRFGTLIGRRPRDQLGRALFAFNAAVFTMHERRQRFAAHADEVRNAVFDLEVAREVERTRDRALDALGSGLVEPPRRVVDARGVDARAFAALTAAAAMLAVLAGWQGGAAAVGVTAALSVCGAAFVAGGLSARLVPAALIRIAAAIAALATVAACFELFHEADFAGMVIAALFGGVGLGVGLRYTRELADGGSVGVLRACGLGIAAALLWGAALGWDHSGLAGSVPVLALPAAALARFFVVPRT